MKKNSKILLTGSSGMLGSSILKFLKKKNFINILSPSRKQLDLLNNRDTKKFLNTYKPDYIINCAALVGGINYNYKKPVDFLYKNLEIQNNIIINSLSLNIKKFIHIGSSCVYPKFSKQPIKEKYLLTGSLEETNEAYAIAKIAGIKLCQSIKKQYNKDYLSVMPTNLYGLNDTYDKNNSHVIPSLILKIHDAKINNKKSVKIWGDGSAKREFLFAEDAAEAILFIIKNYSNIEPINIGSGEEVTINKLVKLICKVINYKGEIIYDKTKPNGTPRKRLDLTKLNKLGWNSKINLKKGLKIVYNNFKIND